MFVLGHDQAFELRFGQIAQRGGQALLAHHRERARVEAVAHAGRQRQHAARHRRQAVDLAAHQVGHVVGRAGRGDALDLAAPARVLGVEGDQAVAVQRHQELRREKRIARGLGQQQLGQRRGVVGLHMQRVGGELRQCRQRERRQVEALDRQPRVLQRGHGGEQGVAGLDLVVAISTHQQQVAQRRARQHRFEQLQRRAVGPLQVVEKEHQRLLGAGLAGDEILERQAQPVVGLGRRQRRRRRQRLHHAEQRRQLGDQRGDGRDVVAERARQPLAPPPQLRRRLGQQALHELAQRLRQRAVRRVAGELLELAADEQTLRARGRLVQLADQRRLADAGIAGHEQQTRSALARALERRAQQRTFGVAPVQTPRHRELLGHVARADLERQHAAMAAPLLAAAQQIALQRLLALIALLRRLGQQLHHDLRQRQRQRRVELGRRLRHFGHVSVHQRQRVGAVERQAAAQQFVEQHAERVEIAAVVAAVADAPAVLRCGIGQAAAVQARRQRRGGLGSAARGVAEIGQADAPRGAFDQHRLRTQAAVHDAAAVQLGQHRGELDGVVEHPAEWRRALAHRRGQGLGAVVVEHERIGEQRLRLGDAVERQVAQQLELTPQQRDVGSQRCCLQRALQQHAGAVAFSPRAAEHESLVASEFVLFVRMRCPEPRARHSWTRGSSCSFGTAVEPKTIGLSRIGRKRPAPM